MVIVFWSVFAVLILGVALWTRRRTRHRVAAITAAAQVPGGATTIGPSYGVSAATLSGQGPIGGGAPGPTS